MSHAQPQARYSPDPATVAAHNDTFRKAVCAGQRPTRPICGVLLVTRSITGINENFLTNALMAVGAFDTFAPDNDPDGYHDFGAIEIDGEKVFFKIDLYQADTDKRWGAETPDKPETVERVLTVMLASDW